MKRYFSPLFLSLAFSALLTPSCSPCKENAPKNCPIQPIPAVSTFETPDVTEESFNFYVVNDLGRNGYYQQKPIAELLGEMAEQVDIEFVAALGDTHHFDGVASTNDPLWKTNYEYIYKHPELMIDWFAIMGNHEYRGNTQAVMDYSNVSRRWNAPDRYYSKTVEVGNNQKALLVFIDTTPLIGKYRQDKNDYPDASKQSLEQQLAWIGQTLKNSDAKWKIVMGHHPVFADTKKSDKERKDMQNHLMPLLDQYQVDAYLCGHIHSFQHIHPQNSEVEYFVNSSGSLARKVNEIEGTRFCSSDAGFMLVSMEDNKLKFYMINGEGKIIYQYQKEK
ncbi:MAG: metallophosphoesterase [Bacteroidales bacterium]